MTDQELIQSREELKNTMVSVSAGGQRIQEVNAVFKEIYNEEVKVKLTRKSSTLEFSILNGVNCD
jgi:hypothetical protein